MATDQDPRDKKHDERPPHEKLPPGAAGALKPGAEGALKPDDVRNPHTRHEPRTINTAGVLLFLGFMVVCAVVMNFTVTGLMNLFERKSRLHEAPPHEIASHLPAARPPAPNLQPDPVGDLHDMREQEDRILQGYGWVDQKAGKVRIPIARAMQLLLERGLPEVNGPAPVSNAAITTTTPPGSAMKAPENRTTEEGRR